MKFDTVIQHNLAVQVQSRALERQAAKQGHPISNTLLLAKLSPPNQRRRTRTLYIQGITLKKWHDPKRSAERWFEDFKTLESKLQVEGVDSEPVKVAIIDTGAVFTKRRAHVEYDDRIKGFWPDDDRDQLGRPHHIGRDDDGHGTHVASALLNVNPFCHVYIARAFHSRSEQLGSQMAEEVQQRVAQAIRHAVDEWNVNILSLSFGFERQIDDIRQALVHAEQNHILVIAACGNFGGRQQWTWPARHQSVLGMYAADGNENLYPRNPTPANDDQRFAALGVAVKGLTPADGTVLRSGTSIATPITAGIAGTLIHFMRQHKEKYLEATCAYSDKGWVIQADSRTPSNAMRIEFDRLVRGLNTHAGMSAVFLRMKTDRAGYRVLVPTALFDNHRSGILLVNFLLNLIGNL
ncbi:hypothetical protein LTR56_027907 [Elasticomyces elasticus]|nr:hypothetical protein LTR56_027907 [Elasticomyces elasticus]